MIELLFLVCFAFIIFTLTRKWSKIVGFLVVRFPFLAGYPLIGGLFQSEDARQSIEKRMREEAEVARKERAQKAREARKLISMPWSGRKPRTFKSHIEKDCEDDDASFLLKRVLTNSLSSHSKLSTSTLPGKIKRKHLETLSYYEYQFQQKEEFREPFDLTVLQPGRRDPVAASPDDIVEKLVERTQVANMVFLTGSIGTGKSTLAAIVQSKLLQKSGRKTSELQELIIPVDFETLRSIVDPSSQKITSTALTDYVFLEIKRHVGKVKEKTFAAHLARSKKKYIFIFDNLDVAYTEFCRHFVEGNQSVQGIIGQTKFLVCLRELVDVFLSIHRKSGVVGPAALFCLRDDTMHLLNQSTEIAGKPSLQDQHIRFLMRESNDNSLYFSTIVHKRSKLVKSMLSVSDAPNETLKLAEDFWNVPEDNAGHFERYVNLSVQGLRTAIHSLARYFSNSRVPVEKMFDALTDPNRIDVLCFINGQEYYSQNNSNITNIFLVNSEYRNNSEIAAVPSKLDIGELFHHHTFWLKFLIFAHIDAKTSSGISNAMFDEIIDVFSETGGFERDLVALIVYSLTEVEHGRLVRPRSSKNARLLTLTSRGREFSKDQISVAWSFTYLASIIEDEWLELPLSITENLIVFGTNGLWDDESYFEYLLHKVGIVQKLLFSLEIAFLLEQERRPNLFLYLTEHLDIDRYIPDFKTLHENTFRQVELMAKCLSHEKQLKIGEKIKLLSAKRHIQRVKKELETELLPLYDYETVTR